MHHDTKCIFNLKSKELVGFLKRGFHKLICVFPRVITAQCWHEGLERRLELLYTCTWAKRGTGGKRKMDGNQKKTEKS